MDIHHVRLITVGALLVPLMPSSASVTPPATLTVRVYDAAAVDTAVSAEALVVAAALLRAADVAVSWRECATDAARDACRQLVQANELLVRLVKAPAAGGPPPSLARLRARSGLPLGDAFVDTSARSGVLATVYADRVALTAEASGVALPVVLGRVIAHELGHLLLASNGHASRGLMRPIWSSDELRREQPSDWMFTPADAKAIRARLARP